jgi:hypothetical protein
VQFSLRRLVFVVTLAAVIAALARLSIVGGMMALTFMIWGCGAVAVAHYVANKETEGAAADSGVSPLVELVLSALVIATGLASVLTFLWLIFSALVWMPRG